MKAKIVTKEGSVVEVEGTAKEIVEITKAVGGNAKNLGDDVQEMLRLLQKIDNKPAPICVHPHHYPYYPWWHNHGITWISNGGNVAAGGGISDGWNYTVNVGDTNIPTHTFTNGGCAAGLKSLK
jgi:hypothetical protein